MKGKRKELGATLLEYVITVSSVAIVCITAVMFYGMSISTSFGESAAAILVP